MKHALVRRTDADTFEFLWEGSIIGSTTLDIPADEDPHIPGDMVEILVDYAEKNDALHQLRIAMLGGVEWSYIDAR